MAKVTVKTLPNKKPVKAGSTNKNHGGFPTAKLILIVKEPKNKK